MVVLYPIGVPAIGAALLCMNRDAIVEFLNRREKCNDGSGEVPKKADEQDFDGDAQTIDRFKSLFLPFKPKYFWWGVGDILNRLLLTGFAVVFEPGTMMQVCFHNLQNLRGIETN